MSGGSYDYAYTKASDMADQLKRSEIPLRRIFGRHLEKVAQAMHDIEWVDSGDYGTGDELEAIQKVLGKDIKKLEIQELIQDADVVIKKLLYLKQEMTKPTDNTSNADDVTNPNE